MKYAIQLVAAAAIFGGLQGAEARADTPAFPDFTTFMPVNPTEYTIDTTTPGIPSNMVVFSTPDGISCNFVIEQAQCTGNNFPGVPPVATDPAKGLNGANWIGTLTRLKKTGNPISTNGTFRDQPIKTLPPFHSITFNGMICGVDDARTTACKDPQGRGFILSPTWSGWLPKV
ncbi:hypothetical protein [Mycolicibacterium cosmeticum]|uniref:hypothetical protein n=1 Tax=Mycolicibacterium cosmeticum TaxID=258533 RepID=UPI003204F9E2